MGPARRLTPATGGLPTAENPIGEPWLDAYAVHAYPHEMRPGNGNRDWMDSFPDRFPYRCLPLVMANSSGWEILCPAPIEITWNGGPRNEDTRIRCLADWPPVGGIAASHFTRGIVTFHTGYLFRTPPGWGVYCSGPPNWPKDIIQPLQGLIETDWLPFPFTMNWVMTAPGRVVFEKDEPFCWITLLPHNSLERVQPNLRQLDDYPDLKEEYDTWSKSRAEFNAKLEAHDPEAVKLAWQRFYMKGEKPTGERVEGHVTKRRLKPLVPKGPGE
jgi:hypothetical protein